MQRCKNHDVVVGVVTVHSPCAVSRGHWGNYLCARGVRGCTPLCTRDARILCASARVRACVRSCAQRMHEAPIAHAQIELCKVNGPVVVDADGVNVGHRVEKFSNSVF